MKSGRTGRRRRRGSRIRPFALMAAVVALLLTTGLLWAATWPGFRPGSVGVVGNHRVPTARILAAAAIDPRANIWLQSSSGISARVLAIRAIEAVAVHRSLPNRVMLDIHERTPVAQLFAGDGNCVVDGSGHLFPALPEDRSLPAVITKEMLCRVRRIPAASATLHLLAVLRRAEAAGIRLVALAHDRYGEDRATLADGTLLFIGDGTQLERKFAEVRALEERLHRSWSNVKALDLRAPSTPVVVDGRKIEGGGLLPINAMKDRGTRVPDRLPTKTSSSHSRAASKNLRSDAPQRASSPSRSASSP